MRKIIKVSYDGKSYLLRIPKEAAEELKLNKDMYLEIETDKKTGSCKAKPV